MAAPPPAVHSILFARYVVPHTYFLGLIVVPSLRTSHYVESLGSDSQFDLFPLNATSVCVPYPWFAYKRSLFTYSAYCAVLGRSVRGYLVLSLVWPLCLYPPGSRRCLEGTVVFRCNSARNPNRPGLLSCPLESLLRFCLVEDWLQRLSSFYPWLLQAEATATGSIALPELQLFCGTSDLILIYTSQLSDFPLVFPSVHPLNSTPVHCVFIYAGTACLSIVF